MSQEEVLDLIMDGATDEELQEIDKSMYQYIDKELRAGRIPPAIRGRLQGRQGFS